VSIESPWDDDLEDAPLDDPAYEPVHQPLAGRIPEVVVRWGKRSQVRWFRRFWSLVWDQRQKLPMVPSKGPFPYERQGESGWLPLSQYWCDSPHHKGPCCGSCQVEFVEGFGVCMDGWCCCQDNRMGDDHE
jgi:hypothetical protein